MKCLLNDSVSAIFLTIRKLLSVFSSCSCLLSLTIFIIIFIKRQVVLIWSVIAFDDEYTTKLKIANIRTVFKLNGISLLSDIHVNTSDTTRPLVDVLMEIKNTSRSTFQVLHPFIDSLNCI